MPILTDEERIGTTVADRYQVDGILGKGGMGIVYAATHTWTGREVALKILKSDLAADASTVRRFLQEARTASTIHHPNVIDVLDMGSDDDGMVFIVMERLFGETLGHRLKEREEVMDPADALEIGLAVLSGLHAAHKAGVLHRDIKPDNIFLSLDTDAKVVPKIVDFGMAKLFEEAVGGQTRTGDLLGTPCYMSPEQAEGEPNIGPQTDVWSAGAVLYHCMAGKRAFDANSTPAVLLQIARGRFTPLCTANPAIPKGVGEAIERALTLDVEHRFPDAASFGRALRDAGRAGGIAFATTAFQSEAEATGTHDAVVPSRPGPNKPLLFGAAGAAALALLMVLGGAVALSGSDPAAAEGPTVEDAADAPGDAHYAAEPTAVDEAPSEPEESPYETDDEATLVAELPPTTRVRIESDPPGAEVRRGDEVLCETPCDVESTEAAELRLVRRRYQGHELEIAAGQEGTVEVALRRRAARRAPSRVPALPQDPF